MENKESEKLESWNPKYQKAGTPESGKAEIRNAGKPESQKAAKPQKIGIKKDKSFINKTTVYRINVLTTYIYMFWEKHGHILHA